jgi:hypothetical protein
MPAPRKPFQFHLSTAIAMMLVIGFLMWLHLTPRRTGHYTIYGWPFKEYYTTDDGYRGSDMLGITCCGVPLTLIALWVTWYTLETCIQSKMSSLRAILMVVLSTAIFTLGFMAGGFFIGKIAPDYYSAMFHFRDATIDPVQLGVGLGLTQGAYVGIVVGVLAVLLEAWYRHKKLKLAQPPGGSN